MTAPTGPPPGRAVPRTVPVRDAVATAAARLTAAGVPSPRVDAELLAAHVLGVDRGRLALAPQLDEAAVAAYGSAVARRALREPLQHVLGVAWFRHLELAVGPGVFVPRPETELLVDHVLAELRDRRGPAVVVDLCTGSGAIALAVAGERPGTTVHAVEADADAYAWAVRNVERTGLPVVLHRADAGAAGPVPPGTADVVTANPPYVPAGTPVPPEVAYDPAVALYAGPDGLDGLRLVARAAARLLRPGGLLVAEHDDTHGEAAPDLLGDTDAGLGSWTDVTARRDLAGRPRFVTARSRVRAGRTPA